MKNIIKNKFKDIDATITNSPSKIKIDLIKK